MCYPPAKNSKGKKTNRFRPIRPITTAGFRAAAAEAVRRRARTRVTQLKLAGLVCWCVSRPKTFSSVKYRKRTAPAEPRKIWTVPCDLDRSVPALFLFCSRIVSVSLIFLGFPWGFLGAGVRVRHNHAVPPHRLRLALARADTDSEDGDNAVLLERSVLERGARPKEHVR